MDISFWKKVASLWSDVRSVDDRKKTESAVSGLFESSIKNRRQERSLIAELLSGIDEEEDDGY